MAETEFSERETHPLLTTVTQEREQVSTPLNTAFCAFREWGKGRGGGVM
jgi:hypothetical protein